MYCDIIVSWDFDIVTSLVSNESNYTNSYEVTNWLHCHFLLVSSSGQPIYTIFLLFLSEINMTWHIKIITTLIWKSIRLETAHQDLKLRFKVALLCGFWFSHVGQPSCLRILRWDFNIKMACFTFTLHRLKIGKINYQKDNCRAHYMSASGHSKHTNSVLVC